MRGGQGGRDGLDVYGDLLPVEVVGRVETLMRILLPALPGKRRESTVAPRWPRDSPEKVALDGLGRRDLAVSHPKRYSFLSQ